MSASRQGLIGLSLAAAILTAWLSLHVWGVFFHRWGAADWILVPLVLVVQTWLSVGLFIIAHDAMHGSLAPGRAGLNRAVGRLALALYAGFWFDGLAPKHHAHHASPGSADDPDFLDAERQGFWSWYLAFFRRYFGLRELAVLCGVIAAYLLAEASLVHLLVFWAAPALLSSLQLFAFGTYLPHRREALGFADEHRARSLGHPWLVSLATCYHFGCFHLTHHRKPGLPWWRLPSGA
ncbi:fatty acid desaturase [Phenylobacterium sp.]|uniref:fatty acid desaturase n=1 Tax=Phenylobacterium sp. TaxID=1871053 RepID=UPI002E35C140|nr:fatty acid desaturase [Phenylobacterium sp.]HEX2558860.1 fatty acid desaturase [Phenylobacterium sp.]